MFVVIPNYLTITYRSCYSQYFSSFKLRLPLVFCDCFIFQIDNDLSKKPKHLLMKYVSHNFGSAISD